MNSSQPAGALKHSPLQARLGDLRRTEVPEELFTQALSGMTSVSLDKITTDELLDFDMFLPSYRQKNNSVTMTKVITAGERISPEIISVFKNIGFGELYLDKKQHAKFIEYRHKATETVINNPEVSNYAKMAVLYSHAMDITEKAFSDRRLGENVALGKKYVNTLTDFVINNPDYHTDMAGILETDYTLYTHSINVCILMVSFAHYLGIGHDKMHSLGMGALFHDVGKREIPREILDKPGRLNQDEWQIMKNHPMYGLFMLKKLRSIPSECITVVHQHHENLDGTGYPRGLQSGRISDGGKMARIIDSYDALTSERVYKEALKPVDAIELMCNESKSQMSDNIMTQFVEFLGSFSPSPKTQPRGGLS